MKISDFIEELKKDNIYVTEDIIAKLEKYYEYLISYNSHTNLTTITKKEDVYLKHFYDSLTVCKAVDFSKDQKVLDIGTGAGFPGVVLKIFFPDIKLYLMDSNAKKTKFLSTLCELLDLKDVIVINDRAENYIKNARNSFDIVTSRAVAKTRIIAELGLPFLKNNGTLVIMKASNIITDEELEEANITIKVLNSKLDKLIRFSLPYENSERNIITIKKEGNIKDIYPRSYDKIIKKPLK